MLRHVKQAFAIWVTGLPAAGKSTIVSALRVVLAEHHVYPAILESDVMRLILTPGATYSEVDREYFYRKLVDLGVVLTQQGVPVIFDATAHRRIYRDWARAAIPEFFEIYVDCSLRTAMERDPKGIYHTDGSVGTVPGLHIPYEAPENPDLVIVSDREEATDAKFPMRAAHRITDLLRARELLRTPELHREASREPEVKAPIGEED